MMSHKQLNLYDPVEMEERKKCKYGEVPDYLELFIK